MEANRKVTRTVTGAGIVSCCLLGCSSLNLGQPQLATITRIDLPQSAATGTYVNATITYQSNIQNSGTSDAITFGPNVQAKIMFISAYVVKGPSSVVLPAPATRSQNIALKFGSQGQWIVQASQSDPVATAGISITGV